MNRRLIELVLVLLGYVLFLTGVGWYCDPRRRERKRIEKMTGKKENNDSESIM